MAEPAQKKTKCERTFLFLPEPILPILTTSKVAGDTAKSEQRGSQPSETRAPTIRYLGDPGTKAIKMKEAEKEKKKKKKQEKKRKSMKHGAMS